MARATPQTDLDTLPLAGLYAALAADGGVRRLFELARDEDLGPEGADLTAHACFPDDAPMTATVRAREAGVVAGLAAVPDLIEAFTGVAPGVRAEAIVEDGSPIDRGDALLRLEGPASSVVVVERPLLNTLGRLSGIATLTRRFADLARPATVYDTRKTTPGWRALEKYAVRCGGGGTHRLGLHDAALIKDNHLASVPDGDLIGWLEAACARARASGPRFVMVEVDRLAQLDAALACEAGLIDYVLLDNFGVDDLRDAVRRRDAAGSGIRLEASGGITLETVADIAATGVERLSVGALTHQATSLDLGLDAGAGRG